MAIKKHSTKKCKNKKKLLKYIFILILIYAFFEIFCVICKEKQTEKEIEKVINKIGINKKNKQLSWKSIKKDFKNLVNRFKYLIEKETNIPEKSPIWMMWYQGIQKAPKIVKICFQSVLINKEKHPVYLLDKHNLNKYIKLPDYIMNKFKRKIIGYQHFSDIVRTGLLYIYGGYWIDSTYFITAPLKKVNTNFVSIKPKYCFTRNHPFIKCLFSINFIGAPKNSFIATYSFASLLLYWKKYNKIISYFLLDYIFDIAYKYSGIFKKIIDEHPYTTCGIFALHRKINNIYKQSDFHCPYNKLKKHSKYIQFKKGDKTNYGYMYENYKFNYKNYISYIKKEKKIDI